MSSAEIRHAGTVSEGAAITAGACAASGGPQEFHGAARVKHPLGAVELVGEPYPAPLPFELLAQTRESDHKVSALEHAGAPEKALLDVHVAARPLGKNLDVAAHHQRDHQSTGEVLAGGLERAREERRPRLQALGLDRQNDFPEQLPSFQPVERQHAAISPSARNDSSASSMTQPWPRGRTRSGLISTPRRRGALADPNRDRSATACANAATSAGGRPRTPSRIRRPF